MTYHQKLQPLFDLPLPVFPPGILGGCGGVGGGGDGGVGLGGDGVVLLGWRGQGVDLDLFSSSGKS